MSVDLCIIRDAVERFPVVLFDTCSVYIPGSLELKSDAERFSNALEGVQEIANIVKADSVVFVPQVVHELDRMIRKVDYIYWEKRKKYYNRAMSHLLLEHKKYLQRVYTVAQRKMVNFVEQKGYIPWLAVERKLHQEVLEETRIELPADPFLAAAAFHESKNKEVCIISNDVDLSRLVMMTFGFVNIFEVQEGGVFLDHAIEVRGYSLRRNSYQVIMNTSSGNHDGGNWRHFRDFAHFKQVWLESYRLLKVVLGLRKAPSVSLAKDFYEGNL